MSAHVRWTGEPARCRCARAVVVGETLDCPASWWFIRGIGWCHVLGGAR